MKVLRLKSGPDRMKMEPATPARRRSCSLTPSLTGHERSAGVDRRRGNQRTDPSGASVIAALDEVRRREGNPAFVRELIAIDVAPLLEPTDFYVLDDHMNARGHGVVAVAVSELLRKRSLAPARP